MNAGRRKELDKAIEGLQELHSAVEMVQEEESEYFDNMPEAFQNGDKGNAAQEVIDALEEALGHIQDAISAIDTAKQ